MNQVHDVSESVDDVSTQNGFEGSDSDTDQRSLPSTPCSSIQNSGDEKVLVSHGSRPEHLSHDHLFKVIRHGTEVNNDSVATQTIPPGTQANDSTPCGKVLVVGVGYVGEELVAAFSSAFQVIAYDVSPARCWTLQEKYRGNNNVNVISSAAEAGKSNFDVALISVPTLLHDDFRTIDTTHITNAVAFVSKYVRPGSLVVIESSVTVGMTRQLLGHLRSRGAYVGFSPERVDPGRVSPRFEDIPKVISGIDEASLDKIRQYYSRVFTTVVPVPTLETAEFTKLYENCQRLMLVHYANELADACESHGVDVFEVCKASATKPFGFTPFTPSLGAGGSCIPINPFYLLTNCDMPVLRHAAEANRERPLIKAREIAKKAQATAADLDASALRRPGPPRVLIYGLGFKKGNALLVCAPAAMMADELVKANIEVTYYDDVVRSDRWARLESMALLSDGQFDVVVVTHSPEPEHRCALFELRKTAIVYFAR